MSTFSSHIYIMWRRGSVLAGVLGMGVGGALPSTGSHRLQSLSETPHHPPDFTFVN